MIVSTCDDNGCLAFGYAQAAATFDNCSRIWLFSSVGGVGIVAGAFGLCFLLGGRHVHALHHTRLVSRAMIAEISRVELLLTTATGRQVAMAVSFKVEEDSSLQWLARVGSCRSSPPISPYRI